MVSDIFAVYDPNPDPPPETKKKKSLMHKFFKRKNPETG